MSNTTEDQSQERLQKVLAAAGIASRRECEELIVTGRVEVDGETVTELGTKVDPESQSILVDGERIRVLRKAYYAVYKPKGVVCTNNDPDGRLRVIDLLPDTQERLFTVGRLDRNSEGLILVTNDGDLAQRLTHPRYGVEKVYRVLVAGEPSPDVLKQLREGVRLAEGLARVKSAKIKSKHKQSTWLEITLTEGMNREIRRVLAKVGHKVLTLRRVSVGPIRLAQMEPGMFRRLEGQEVRDLWAYAKGIPLKKARKRTKPSSPRSGASPRPVRSQKKRRR